MCHTVLGNLGQSLKSFHGLLCLQNISECHKAELGGAGGFKDPAVFSDALRVRTIIIVQKQSLQAVLWVVLILLFVAMGMLIL